MSFARQPSDGDGSQGVALLGLGEAGSALAADLVAQGVRVWGWDPDPSRSVAGVEPLQEPADVAVAEIVLSVNSPSAALDAARDASQAMTAGHVYVDANTASARLKREVAAEIEPSGAAFVDAALLDPVPAGGIRTRCLASGPGADRFAEAFRAWGMPVQTLGGLPGDAATRKLLRSIVMKGLAAAVLESLSAARAAGCEEWMRGEIEALLDGADARLLDRLIIGSFTHAERRVGEMQAAASMEAELGVEPYVALAAAAVLRELSGSP